MGFACTCLRRRSMPTLPPMCYHVERVNNRKPTTLQTTKGQCFQLDPTNECFAIRPFTRNRSCVTEGRWQRTKSRPPCKKTRGQLSGRPDQCYHRALHTKRHFPVGHRLTFCWREADVSRAHKKRGRWDKNAPGQKTSKPTQMRVRHRREHIRGSAGQHFTFCWSGTGSRQRRDKSVKSAGGDTRMQGVRKRPGQRIGLEDAPPSTLISAGAPCGRRAPKVTQANKERERRDKNARGQKTSRPTHKRVRQSPL